VKFRDAPQLPRDNRRKNEVRFRLVDGAATACLRSIFGVPYSLHASVSFLAPLPLDWQVGSGPAV
jgi:hypothetical protein